MPLIVGSTTLILLFISIQRYLYQNYRPDERSEQLDGGFAHLRNGWNLFVSRYREEADSSVYVEGFSDGARSTATTLRFSVESSKIYKIVVLNVAVRESPLLTGQPIMAQAPPAPSLTSSPALLPSL